MFKWRDRDGAVNQAAYRYIKSRNWVTGNLDELTAEEIEERQHIFDPSVVYTFDEKGTLITVVDEVLGAGSTFKGFFCTDPESMRLQQWVRFRNDVEREIERRDSHKKELDLLNQVLEKNHASSGSEHGFSGGYHGQGSEGSQTLSGGQR